MCGICGFVKLNNDSHFIGEAYIKAMTDQIFLRGPDGEGAWLEPQNNAGLGHRRLSIIDLSEAAS